MRIAAPLLLLIAAPAFAQPTPAPTSLDQHEAALDGRESDLRLRAEIQEAREAVQSAGAANLQIIGGFCFPVERWDGREYALHRFQYEGKPCKPPR
jgi:hypothetical protein